MGQGYSGAAWGIPRRVGMLHTHAHGSLTDRRTRVAGPTLLERIIAAALEGWTWDGSRDALRDRLAMVPDGWDPPAGVHKVELGRGLLVAIPPGKGKRQTWSWGHVERVARQI